MLVLDANILIRAVLGLGAKALIREYASGYALVAPDSAFSEARTHIPLILRRRRLKDRYALVALEELAKVISSAGPKVYASYESAARERLRGRDENDWPVLATAIALNCPVWTEDYDFFGAGVATWTSDRIGIYLREQ